MHASLALMAAAAIGLANAGAVDQYFQYSGRNCTGLINRHGSIEIANSFNDCRKFARTNILSAQISYEGLGPIFFYHDTECKYLLGQSYFPETTQEGYGTCVSVPEDKDQHIMSYRLSNCQYNENGMDGGRKCGPSKRADEFVA